MIVTLFSTQPLYQATTLIFGPYLCVGGNIIGNLCLAGNIMRNCGPLWHQYGAAMLRPYDFMSAAETRGLCPFIPAK